MKITHWTFVTPRKLSNAVLLAMYKAAGDVDLIADHQESTFLAVLLAKNQHLLDDFPWIHADLISSQLSELIAIIGKKTDWNTPKDTRPLGPLCATTEAHSTDAKEVRSIVANPIDETGKGRLRSIIYRSTDLVAQVEAIGALLLVRDVTRDSNTDMIALCDIAIGLADQIPAPSCKAEFIAYKGVFLSDMFSVEYLHYKTSAKMDLAIGFPMLTLREHEKAQARLEWLRSQLNDHFAQAISLAQELNAPDCMARVLLHVGDAAGRRFLTLSATGEVHLANDHKKLCIESFMTAKNIFAALGQEDNVAQALHNLANQLRFFGEIEEAKEITTHVLQLAEKHSDFRLKNVATILMTRLNSGEVPDYLGGSSDIPKRI